MQVQESEAITKTMSIGDVSGRVVIHMSDGQVGAVDSFDVFGKWASHTGYRHVSKYDYPPGSRLTADSVAQDLYEENVRYCYLVGDEHRDSGWRCVSSGYPVTIRLPEWSAQSIRRCLLDAGFQEIDPNNHFWAHPEISTCKDMKRVVAPLLSPRTRLQDEAVLAERLTAHWDEILFGADRGQLALF